MCVHSTLPTNLQVPVPIVQIRQRSTKGSHRVRNARKDLMRQHAKNRVKFEARMVCSQLSCLTGPGATQASHGKTEERKDRKEA